MKSKDQLKNRGYSGMSTKNLKGNKVEDKGNYPLEVPIKISSSINTQKMNSL